MFKIKIDKADTEFSKFIRARDGWRCVRCHSYFSPNKRKNLDCSHYFGRGRENTRYDPENCDSLCCGCHQIWGSDDREAYRHFKIKQLGENGFNALQIRANTYHKKDRVMELIKIREMIKELNENNK